VENKNFAMGNAQVGNQVGNVEGDFNSGNFGIRRHEDLAVQLNDLQQAMANARVSGRIDNASADAISSELEAAAKCLPIEGGDSKNGFVLAMKRAKGLAEGLAEITVKITAAIAAAARSNVTDAIGRW
jgi:8-oxo-dGTP diphosphatase